MEVPSMVRRSGGKLIVRHTVSGEQLVLDEATKTEVPFEPEPSTVLIYGDRKAVLDNAILPRQRLPQCKIKRNYSCDRCSYFTQNPRSYLTHLRDTHATIDLSNTSVKSEMDAMQSTISSPEQDTTRNKGKEKNVRPSVDDNESIPKKRARPIPNLIPLATGGTTIAARPEKELLKPVPMSMLMPPETNTGSTGTTKCPISTESLTSRPVTSTLGDPHTKCTFCELNFNTTVELANHIAAAHKEDLITSLLQKSIDDSNPNIFPQSEAIESASNEMWKTLLEVNTFTNSPPDAIARGKEHKPAGKRHSKDDEEVEILDHKSETYCGVETAPGYGEVTSKISSTEANAAGLMKKVFKCPHCSFWASTASRFHVHIVGHLNKKPFECSLCSYRSNWRWDITKHIRLKTIRDPSHKNAGVLMNDETGRRNYTKYNKYITLMQITDNSTREPSNYAKSFAENNVSDLVSACGTYNIDVKAFANIPGLGFLLEDKQMGNEESAAKSDDSGVPMKCQVCEFRTTSKEELLLHFTSTHNGLCQLEDVIDNETISMSGHSSTQQSKNNSTTNMSSTPTPPAAAFCSLSKSAANTSNDSLTNGTLLTASGVGDKTNSVMESGDRSGEGDSGNQRMAMHATWRHNAPYRCGHCHQVSNWKHVIQRHCRLKHNGHVFIEHVNSEKDDPSDSEGQLQRNGKPSLHHSVYVIEDVIHPVTTDHTRKSIETYVTSSIPPPLAPFSMQDDVGCSVNTLEPIVEIIDKDPTDIISFSGGLMPSTVLVDSGTVAPAVPSEQLECISCQFRAETAEQLTEHLEQHMSNGPDGGSNSFDSTGLIDPVPTTMYYCPRCPARFFHEQHVVEHGEKHIAIEGSLCRFCSYTTTDDEERNRHEDVHSAAYNINTDNLQIFLAESKEYPKPHLTLQETSDGAQLFYVENAVMENCAMVSGTRSLKKSKKHSKQNVRSSGERSSLSGDGIGTDEHLRSIFLCEYCDQTFDVESELNKHVQTHFSSILSPQDVAYYTSLSSTLNKEKKLELIVSGAQSTMALHYVYDNVRKKDWNVYSKTESVLLKF